MGSIKFGIYGIKSICSGFLLIEELETLRKIITRITKRIITILIRVFFHLPITIKPLKSRMGKGVGLIKFWVSFIKIGTILFEFSYMSKNLGLFILKSIKPHISLKINLIAREIYKK